MRDASELARLLVRGLLKAESFPELADEQVAAEVRERLNQVGCELVLAGDHYLARAPETSGPTDGLEQPLFSLDEAELAVAAALYLHLRYLPRHGRVETVGGRHSVEAEEIERLFPVYTRKKMGMLLGRLRNGRFLSRADERFYAGPFLYAFNEVEADERASEALRNFRLRRYLREYAGQLSAGDEDDELEDEGGDGAV